MLRPHQKIKHVPAMKHKRQDPTRRELYRTCEEVARILGVTRQYVAQTERRALAKLRRVPELREFLNCLREP